MSNIKLRDIDEEDITKTELVYVLANEDQASEHHISIDLQCHIIGLTMLYYKQRYL